MNLKDKRIGFALTGSFCTFDKVIPVIESLIKLGADVTPIISFSVADYDTRFNKKDETKHFLRMTTGKEIINTIIAAEPIGPQELLDLIIVAPCTGNTLAKIATGITDTPVTLAVKAHLRNQSPVLIAISTNDGLGANGKNLGLLLNSKNIYFVPFRQDNHIKKCNSIVSDMHLIIDAAKKALDKKQLQPLILGPKILK